MERRRRGALGREAPGGWPASAPGAPAPTRGYGEFPVVDDGREGAAAAVWAGRERVDGLAVRFGQELIFIRSSRVRPDRPRWRLVCLDER